MFDATIEPMGRKNLTELIQQLLSSRRLPLTECIRCGEPVEAIRAATVTARGESVVIPVSSCAACVKHIHFQNAEQQRTELERFATVQLLIIGFGIAGSLMTSSVIPVLLALFYSGAATISECKKQIARRRADRSLILSSALFRELFGDSSIRHVTVGGEWLAYSPDESASNDAIVMLTPTDGRVNSRELQSFLVTLCNLLDRAMQTICPDRNLDCQIAVAILPSQKILLEVQSQPEYRECSEVERYVEQRIESLPRPAVVAPVAFMRRVSFGGGAIESGGFSFPLSRFLKEEPSGDMDELLLSMDEPPPLPAEDSAHDWSEQDYSELIRETPENIPALLGRAELRMARHEMDAALADFESVVELRPADPDLLARRADCLGLSGDLSSALDEYTRALQTDPEHIHSLNNRAMLHLNEGRATDALTDLKRAIKIAPDEVRLYVGMALTLRRIGKTSLAFSKLNEAIFRQPEYGQAYFERARLFVDDGRFERALRDVRLAIRFDPADIDFQLYQAQLLAHMGKHALAIDALTQLTDHSPEVTIAWGLRGISHQELDQYDESIEDCSHAIEDGLELPRVFFARAIAYRSLDRDEEALPDLDRIIELEPEHAAAYNARGLIKADQEDYEAAITDFTSAIEYEPEWALPYFYRGNAHAEQEEMRHAIMDYERATRLMPELAAAHTNRGIAHARLGEDAQAMNDFSAAIQSDASFVPGYFERATKRIEAGDYRGAIRDLNAVLEQTPESIPALYARAGAWHELEELDKAIEDLDEIIRIHPEFAAVYCQRGRIWFEKGDRQKGESDFEEAARLDPDEAEEIRQQQLISDCRGSLLHQQFDQSRETADQLLEEDPECFEAVFLRAFANWHSGLLVEACDDLTQLIDETEEPGYYTAFRGQVYLDLGEFELAAVDLDIAFDLAEDSDDEEAIQSAFSARAVIAEHDNDIATVESMLELAMQFGADRALTHYNHGLVYLDRDEPAKAATCFRVAMSLLDLEFSPIKARRAKSFLENADKVD